jgi:glycogen debranching enzyme
LYVPYYDNSDNSAQVKTAHGFSYHNGPEWVWLYGFYVVAKLNFDAKKLSKQQMLGLLQEHNNYINND